MSENNRTALLLIAEDDQFYANLYKTKLEKEGFAVVISTNGSETLRLIEESKPNLIILDIVMPELDGFEVLKQLKSKPDFKNVPVIVLSNLGQQEDIDRALSLGAFRYIVKSNVSIHDMVESVEEALKESQSK